MYINNLITGSLTLGSGGSTPSPYFAYDSNRVITGLYQGSPNVYEEGGWTYGGADVVENYATAIGDNAFNDHDYDMGDTLFSKAISGNITFQNITSIGDYAFANCYNLMNITMLNVTSIGSSAFSNCGGLTNVTMPNLTSIGNYAFMYCYSLTSMTIPDSVTSIGSRAFYYCDGLTSVTIPDSVTSIEEDAFNCCSCLTSVTIGSGIQEIGSGVFST